MNIELVRGSSATVPTSLSEADEVDKGVTAWKGKARSSATAPLLGSPSDDHAVTLDISADHKKIKLHLNRPLIQRLLDEKSGRGADEKSGRGVKHKRLQHQVRGVALVSESIHISHMQLLAGGLTCSVEWFDWSIFQFLKKYLYLIL